MQSPAANGAGPEPQRALYTSMNVPAENAGMEVFWGKVEPGTCVELCVVGDAAQVVLRNAGGEKIFDHMIEHDAIQSVAGALNDGILAALWHLGSTGTRPRKLEADLRACGQLPKDPRGN